MQQSIARRTGCRLSLTTLLVVAAVAWMGTTPAFGQRSSVDIAAPEEQVDSSRFSSGDPLTISVTIPVGTYQTTRIEGGHEVFVDNLGYLLVPGKPALPSRIFALAIPPGAEVVDVSFDTGEGIILPGTYDIPPAPLPRVICQEDPLIYEQHRQKYEENYDSVYGSDDAYPKTVVELVRTAGYRKYNLVDVRVTPFTYRPLSGELTYYPDITVHVNYRFPANPRPAILDNLARTERTANEIILNYDQVASFYPQVRSIGRGLHDFVIITTDSLTSSVIPLVQWETQKGRTVEVVTTSWVSSNYPGHYDLAASIRAFLRDKYPSGQWGIEDVLLVGHYDDVPMRRTWQDLGYGKPETDLYYAELSLPDSESWDANGNHLYGEDSDPIDFYSEVNVGRIPWSEPATVLSICDKSAAYEQNGDPSFKKNILLLGAFFWPDTDTAVLMEAKANQPWMSDWTMTRMYEQTEYYSTYPCDYPLLHSNVTTVWSSGKYAFVNWAGHGSPTSSHIYGSGAPFFIWSGDCPSLNDSYPAIIFADACSNSDTDYLNIGQAMLKQGAVGFLGATKVAFGAGGWSNPYSGSSQSLDYFFTTSVTSSNYTQGEAHQRALRQMYTLGLWYLVKYEMFEWGALWGNPDLDMACVSYDGVVPLPEDSLGISCVADGQCPGRARCVQGVCYAPKHRYISIRLNPAQALNTARRIRLQGGTFVGWVGAPYENRGVTLADVVPSPVYAGIDFTGQWPELVNVTGCEIVTGQAYVVQAIEMGEDINEEGDYSAPLILRTPSVWGDTVSTCEGDVCNPPNGIVGLEDIMAGIKKYQSVDVAPLTWLDIDPSTGDGVPEQIIGVGDIMKCIDGYQGKPYPGLGPLNCP